MEVSLFLLLKQRLLTYAPHAPHVALQIWKQGDLIFHPPCCHAAPQAFKQGFLTGRQVGLERLDVARRSATYGTYTYKVSLTWGLDMK